ncbi:unnamed protein product [Somion occarium]|uniref:Dynein heavy chain tail domain-containing protein n=1 Tax=Somion occarium TaxID=3059160 RepID=A0ABP1E7X0_9APHY
MSHRNPHADSNACTIIRRDGASRRYRNIIPLYTVPPAIFFRVFDLCNLQSYQNALDAVQQISADTLSIKQSFDAVYNYLSTVKNSVHKDARREEVSSYVSNWSELRMGYGKLLWESREIAIRARESANDFTHAFIDDVLLNNAISILDIKTQISQYASSIEREKTQSIDVVNHIHCLIDNVNDFRRRWSTSIYGQEPRWWRFGMYNNIQWYEINDVFTVLSSKMASVGRNMKRVFQSNSLDRAQEFVAPPLTSRRAYQHMDNIADKLNTITNIWMAIADDLMSLGFPLDLVVNHSTEPNMRTAFIKRCQNMREKYIALFKLYDCYGAALCTLN